MAKRHIMRQGDWESIFGRLQELVMANAGEDPFEEIFKLLVAKLFSELEADKTHLFSVVSSPTQVAENINLLLCQANHRWKGILEGPAHINLSNEHVTVCVEAIQNHSLLATNLEVLDGVFEFLISRVAKGAKGQYFTPRHVVDCCVRIVSPMPNETIMDPACGSGGFLIHALNQVLTGDQSPARTIYCRDNLWGFDFDPRAIRVAKALMLIAGDGHTNLYRLNSLLTPGENVNPCDFKGDHTDPNLAIEDVMRARIKDFSGFDIIMTNPPFAGEIREDHILRKYQIHKINRRIERDVLFLERCIQLLKPGGRLAIVLPHNKFGSNAWGYVREWLLSRLQVVAVLGLGRNTFLPHTHQKASVLFGIKRRSICRNPNTDKILFMISEKDGKDSKGQALVKPEINADEPLWLRADHDLDQVVAFFHDFVQSAHINWRT